MTTSVKMNAHMQPIEPIATSPINAIDSFVRELGFPALLRLRSAPGSRSGSCLDARSSTGDLPVDTQVLGSSVLPAKPGRALLTGLLQP